MSADQDHCTTIVRASVRKRVCVYIYIQYILNNRLNIFGMAGLGIYRHKVKTIADILHEVHSQTP